jgi:serine/threonine protein kinase
MEYVDGTSLQEIVGKHGTMDIFRAAHYVRQAALGLQHAFEIGFVHRDIKPANLLLDRQGTVKILDMGLAHFVPEEQRKVVKDKSKERRIVGTDDYLAPEQIVNSDAVDIRADIYGLGATLYFLLTGNAPFQDAKTDWSPARSGNAVPQPRCAAIPGESHGPRAYGGTTFRRQVLGIGYRHTGGALPFGAALGNTWNNGTGADGHLSRHAIGRRQ